MKYHIHHNQFPAFLRSRVRETNHISFFNLFQQHWSNSPYFPCITFSNIYILHGDFTWTHVHFNINVSVTNNLLWLVGVLIWWQGKNKKDNIWQWKTCDKEVADTKRLQIQALINKTKQIVKIVFEFLFLLIVFAMPPIK